MVTGYPARRDPCDDKLRQATLVDFRGSNLSDAGSIPAISTNQIDQHLCWSISIKHLIREINEKIILSSWISHPAHCLPTGNTDASRCSFANSHTASHAH